MSAKVFQHTESKLSMRQLEGKVAFITGGASGIGAACARRLAAEGAGVVITDLDDATGAALVAAINAQGGTASYLHQPVGWSGNSNNCVQGSGHAKTCCR